MRAEGDSRFPHLFAPEWKQLQLKPLVQGHVLSSRFRGKFKEICERPNGVCQLYCLETEVYVGRCLNRRPCCLPMGNQPRVEDDTPKS
ncbi:beta-defensin 108B [Alexandromys fortis]|uniref:beta-defensin 108B n=1 Tax=Alexandromys fortis TaxID=100897 RepID=UPI002152A9FD|nr:beta-defensin 108B [Microtus fortis]